METVPAAELLARGHVARGEKRLKEARDCFAQAVDAYRKTDDKKLLADALCRLGQIERDLGNGGEALKHYGAAVELLRNLGAPLALAHTVRHVADILREQKWQPEKAMLCYEEALAIYRGHAETPTLDLANTIRGYAHLKADTGDAEEATLLWHEAMALYAECGVQAGVAESQSQIAFLMGR